MNDTTSAIILAAGKGTRMGSDLAKVLHLLAGRPLLAHVLDACRAAGCQRLVVVVGHQRERVEEAVRAWWRAAGGYEPVCVVQDRQLGTGHAVRCAEAAVPPGSVVVACGDSPLLPAALLRDLLARHQAGKAACTAVAARLPDPGTYGRMVVDAEGDLDRIVEYKDASPAERAIDLINSGLYAFDRDSLFRLLAALKPTNAQGEYYLTDVIGMLRRESRRVGMIVTDDHRSILGVNTPADLAEAERIFHGR